MKPCRQETAQRVPIARQIGLIGMVGAFLLLCFAQSFEPAMRLYRAKPENLPPWAEQGNFRFTRLDGGRIESWKAERTWWGKKFSAKEKDVLTHIYDRDFDQMLGLLKQADFNIKRSISSKSRRVEFRGESLECQFGQMKTMPRKDRVSTLSDVENGHKKSYQWSTARGLRIECCSVTGS